jgi:hypothetical protein
MLWPNSGTPPAMCSATSSQESCWNKARASVKQTMNLAGSAPGFLSLTPQSSSASATSSGLTHRATAPSRT